ncbi:MAG TPA: MarR family transcriptional regulator [Actinomycetales bacterium]
MDSPEPRWLTACEQQAWRSYIRAVRLVDERLRRGLEVHDLSHPEYEILVRLSEAPDRVARMSELADDTVSSRSRLTHTVTRLERKGWVRRRPCPADGRGVDCLLTDEGFAALAEAARSHVAEVREVLLDALTPQEFLQLGAALGKVADRIEAAGGSAA